MKINTVFVLLLLLLLSGCGLGRRSEAEPTPAPVELTLITTDAISAWSRAENSMIEQFQQLHPHIEFDQQGYFQPFAYYLESQPAPDIIATQSDPNLVRAVSRGQLVDLSDIWEQSSLPETIPASLHSATVFDGKHYFIPIGYVWNGIYYNKEVFARYNLQPPRTWDELTRICDTLLDNGITPLSLSGEDTFLAMIWFDYLNLRLNGPDVHQAVLRHEIPYDDARIVAVLEFWSSLFANGYFIAEPLEISGLSSVTAIVRGDAGQLEGEKTAMVLAGPVWLEDMPPNFQEEIDWFPFPQIDPDIPHGEVVVPGGYVAPALGDHVPEAVSFLAHVASPEAQTQMAEQIMLSSTGMVPANMGVGGTAQTGSLQQAIDLIEQADAATSFFMLQLSDTGAYQVSLALRNFLRTPTDVQAFASALEAARQDNLDAISAMR